MASKAAAVARAAPRPIDTLVITSSIAVISAVAAAAFNSSTPQEKPKKLQAVQVTGSLIPRAQIEGASPITTVTASDIEKKGFVDTYDALRSLPVANGAVQDPQFTGGYTPAAKTISLFGLSPSFTLTLLNGRPMASYPLAYNGNNNITDIANIPVGLIDHIETIAIGGAPVYGSDAIAGTVNIILKKNYQGFELTGQASISDRGDAANQSLRAQEGLGATGRGGGFGCGPDPTSGLSSRTTPAMSLGVNSTGSNSGRR